MKRQWLAYLIVGVLSIVAGVAIAGLPDNVPVGATIVPPSTTEVPAQTLPDRTEPSTTTTAAPATTTTTAAPPTTPAPSADTTAPPEPVLPARGELRTAVANGANISGTATRFATLLEGIGYVEVSVFDAPGITETSVVYHAPGLELSAARLAVDLGLAPTTIAPLAAAPPVAGLDADTELLAFIGRDLA